MQRDGVVKPIQTDTVWLGVASGVARNEERWVPGPFLRGLYEPRLGPGCILSRQVPEQSIDLSVHRVIMVPIPPAAVHGCEGELRLESRCGRRPAGWPAGGTVWSTLGAPPPETLCVCVSKHFTHRSVSTRCLEPWGQSKTHTAPLSGNLFSRNGYCVCVCLCVCFIYTYFY